VGTVVGRIDGEIFITLSDTTRRDCISKVCGKYSTFSYWVVRVKRCPCKRKWSSRGTSLRGPVFNLASRITLPASLELYPAFAGKYPRIASTSQPSPQGCLCEGSLAKKSVITSSAGLGMWLSSRTLGEPQWPRLMQHSRCKGRYIGKERKLYPPCGLQALCLMSRGRGTDYDNSPWPPVAKIEKM